MSARRHRALGLSTALAVVPAVVLAVGVSCSAEKGAAPQDPAPASAAAPAAAPAQSPEAPGASALSPAAMPEPGSPREADARAAVGKLKASLQQALQGALAPGGGGPVAAIEVCRTMAPTIASGITAETASAHPPTGIRVGRTSHRLRNAANAPEEWLQPALQAYVAGTETAPSLTIALPDGSLGYVEPLRVQAPCLQCHGAAEQIAPGVKEILATAYPADAATGFKEGDFRGLAWALVPPQG